MMAKRQFNIRDTLIVVAVLSGCFVVGLFGYLRRERQENTMSGFSSTVQDPAGYWGDSSVSVAVSSDQADRIVWNGKPDDLSNGYVVMAIRQGQVMFFLIRADGTMNVNGRAFSTFPSTYGSVARGMSDEELRYLALIRDTISSPSAVRKMNTQAITPAWQFKLFLDESERILKESGRRGYGSADDL